MKVLVVGSGAREHAIIWRLSKDINVDEIICLGQNAGVSEIAKTIQVDIEDIEQIREIIIENNPDLVVIGPEGPLSNGITDVLSDENIKVFGPTKSAAQIESSKIFSKKLMLDNNIPTAYAEFFNNAEKAISYGKNKGFNNLVIKADGLAAGKGVFLPSSNEEMEEIIKMLLVEKKLGASGEMILLEDRIYGPEVSVFSFTDGINFSTPIAICDYKRVHDNDMGPNTGGMGCYTPPEFWDESLSNQIINKIISPTLNSMNKNQTPFQGILYAGIMITESGPQVIEFNCRFGDPECELIMPMFQGNLSEVFLDIANQKFDSKKVSWKNKKGVCVVLCSGGYPNSYKKGLEISGIDKIKYNLLFHAGTKKTENKIITDGGRVLVLSNLDENIMKSRSNIYKEIDKIKFEGSFYRKDIGLRAENNE